MTNAPVKALDVRSIVHHHHVRLIDLAGFLGEDVTVNVTRNVEIVEDGPRKIPYDEVVLELTDDEVAQRLTEAGTIPRSKRTLPRVEAEQLRAVISEMTRELSVRRRVFPRWVEEGKITPEVMHVRIAMLSTGIEILRQLLAMVPGGQTQMDFEQAA
ncbi:MAG: hypothetical protein AAGI52_06485 [Bacteroidota bacterium]